MDLSVFCSTALAPRLSYGGAINVGDITVRNMGKRDIYEIFINTLRPRQNGRHFPDDFLKCIFLNENVWILVKIPLKFVPKGPINNIPALVQIMAWRRPGDKPLSEPMSVFVPTHICVTRPQWVKFQKRIGVNREHIFRGCVVHITLYMPIRHSRNLSVIGRKRVFKTHVTTLFTYRGSDHCYMFPVPICRILSRKYGQISTSIQK